MASRVKITNTFIKHLKIGKIVENLRFDQVQVISWVWTKTDYKQSCKKLQLGLWEWLQLLNFFTVHYIDHKIFQSIQCKVVCGGVEWTTKHKTSIWGICKYSWWRQWLFDLFIRGIGITWHATWWPLSQIDQNKVFNLQSWFYSFIWPFCSLLTESEFENFYW